MCEGSAWLNWTDCREYPVVFTFEMLWPVTSSARWNARRALLIVLIPWKGPGMISSYAA
jgi:hypothetical protein